MSAAKGNSLFSLEIDWDEPSIPTSVIIFSIFTADTKAVRVWIDAVSGSRQNWIRILILVA